MSDEAKTTAIATAKASPLMILGARFNIDPSKLIDVLRGTVIKPVNGKQATNEEVAAFCIVANQYQLNPFTREIHAFSGGDKGIVPIVGIDGWTHIVNSTKSFDGCEFSYADNEDTSPLSVTCTMHVKERSHPVVVTEYYAECKRNSGPWQTMPRRMLRHKAYMQAARYAFGLAGIYDEDEARDIMANAKPVFEMPTLLDNAPPPVLPMPVATEPVPPPAAAPDPAGNPSEPTVEELRDLVIILHKQAGGASGPMTRAKKAAKITGDWLAVEDPAVLRVMVEALKAEQQG